MAATVTYLDIEKIMMTLFNEKIIARCMVGATLLCMPMSHNEMKAQPTLTFSTEKRGPLMSDLHYGLFYEEINHGGDGGLYAELIRNRSFEDNVSNPDCWWGLGGMKMEFVSLFYGNFLYCTRASYI